MRNFKRHLVLLFTALMFLSSCASVFEGRNYSSYNYVKVKKNKEEIVQSKPSDSPENLVQDQLAQKEKGIAIADQSDLIKKKELQQKESVVKSEGKTEVKKGLGGMRISDFNLKNIQVPIAKKQIEKIESQSKEIFGDLDHDLRLALILFIVAVILVLFVWLPEPVGLIFGIASTICVIIALIYLIKYLVENG